MKKYFQLQYNNFYFPFSIQLLQKYWFHFLQYVLLLHFLSCAIHCNVLIKKKLTNENLQWVKYANEIENGSWWWIQNNEENFQFFMNFVHFNLNASKCRERKLIFFDKFPNKCAILATKKKEFRNKILNINFI